MKKFLMLFLCFIVFGAVKADEGMETPSGYSLETTLTGAGTYSFPACRIYCVGYSWDCFWIRTTSGVNVASSPKYAAPLIIDCDGGYVDLPAGNYNYSIDHQINVYVSTPLQAPNITSSTSLSKTAGSPFSYTITASGDTPITFGCSGLPAYLSYNSSTHTVSGTLPYSSTGYSFSFNVTASNSAGDDSETVTTVVTSAGAPVWDTTINVSYDVDASFNIMVSPEWVSGPGVIDVSIETGSSLPFWMDLDGNVLSGVCGAPGTYTFRLSASNEYGVSGKLITFNVVGGAPVYAGPTPPVIQLVKGAPFSINLGNVWDNETSVAVIAGLPSWASVNNSILSGTVPPEEIRQFITGMTMRATNAYGYSEHYLEFEISGNSDFYFTSPMTSTAVIGQTFNYTATTNLPSGVTYSISNAPSWLSCSTSGSVSGVVPEGITGFSFTVSASHYELGSISMIVHVSVGTDETGSGGAPNHVVVDNFSDFGNIQWANDMKGLLSNSNQTLANMQLSIDSMIQRQESINNNLEMVVWGIDAVNANLVQINSDMNTGFSGVESSLDDLSDVVSGFGLDLDNIYDEQQKQTGVLEDIRDALIEHPSDVPDMSVDYIEEVHSSGVSVSFFDNYLNRNYSHTAPVITLPLSVVHSSISDYSFDFSQPSLHNPVQYLRLIELGGVFIWCLILIFRTIRTFEF